MDNNNDGFMTDRMFSDLDANCKELEHQAQTGVKFLKQYGASHGSHDMSIEELAEVGKNAAFERLMASPAFLKWRNISRHPSVKILARK